MGPRGTENPSLHKILRLPPSLHVVASSTDAFSHQIGIFTMLSYTSVPPYVFVRVLNWQQPYRRDYTSRLAAVLRGGPPQPGIPFTFFGTATTVFGTATTVASVKQKYCEQMPEYI